MTVQLGIIGCGDVAFRTYIPALQQLTETGPVTACFDPVPQRAERAAAKFPGATAYDTYEAFLAHPGLTGVINLTPPPFHYDTNIAAFDAGLHVFSEKPLSTSVAQAQALIAYAKKKQRHLLCAPAVMTTPRMQWIKSFTQAGRLGRLTLATGQQANMGPAAWRVYTGDPAVFYKPGVGPMVDLGVYALHAITGILGPVKRIQAMGGVSIPERNVLIDRLAGEKIAVSTPDHILLHLDFGNAAFGQVLASFATPRSKTPALEVHGENGSLSISMETWYNGDGPIDLFLRDDSPVGLDGWMNGVTPPSSAGMTSSLIGSGPAHFIEVIAGRAQPILTAEHATHTLEIMLRSGEAIETGRTIDLETRF
jgi:predicted dehydrogenase